MLCELRSLDHEDLRFRVITPGQFFDDYEPVLGDEDVNLLGLTSAEEALVLLVLKPGESLASTTANLVAPIVVNTTNRRAAQVILDDSRSEEHPSELQSLMRISYAVFCLKKKTTYKKTSITKRKTQPNDIIHQIVTYPYQT